jgi:hypothetical protein
VISASSSRAVAVAVSSDKKGVVYTPPTSGTSTDTFTYIARNDAQLTGTGTVTLTTPFSSGTIAYAGLLTGTNSETLTRANAGYVNVTVTPAGNVTGFVNIATQGRRYSFIDTFKSGTAGIALNKPRTCIRSTVHCSNLGAWRLEFASRADPGLLAHPPGCFLFFSVIRGCRCAQPPAICCHASGMKNRPFTAKWGGNRELLSSPNW